MGFGDFMTSEQRIDTTTSSANFPVSTTATTFGGKTTTTNLVLEVGAKGKLKNVNPVISMNENTYVSLGGGTGGASVSPSGEVSAGESLLSGKSFFGLSWTTTFILAGVVAVWYWFSRKRGAK